ncbi:MAG: hypothetical protein NVSMB25_06300 [Thermoleophilaceae bacterium]
MTPQPQLAAVLSTGEPERLYSGLSVLVSATGEGTRCTVLVTFRALDLIMDPDLGRRVQETNQTPSLTWVGRETFAASLIELLDTALALEGITFRACSASVETMDFTPATVEERLGGVISTPRFLAEIGASPLIFI